MQDHAYDENIQTKINWMTQMIELADNYILTIITMFHK